MNNVASEPSPGFHVWASALTATLTLGAAGLLSPSQARAADPLQSVPVRVGVMAPYMVQPGGTASAFYEIPLDEPVDGEGLGSWRSKLFVGPQLGVFTRPDSHSSVLAGGLFGYRLHSPGGCCFHDVSLGLAYLGRLQLVSLEVELATGEVTENRQLQHQFLPTVHYTFGWEFLERWGWYIDLNVGQTISAQVPSALHFGVETGLQVRFGQTGG